MDARPFAVNAVIAATSPPASPPKPSKPVEVIGQPALVTPRLVLRALTPGDRAGFVDLLMRSRDHLRGRINVHAGGEPDSLVFERLMAATDLGEVRATDWRRAAFLPTGQPVGMVHVLNIRRGMEFRGDAGWWVGPAYCGNGIATEMVSAMVQHALRDLPVGLGLTTVCAAIAPGNTASQRVATHAGFRRVDRAMVSVVLGGSHEVHDLWEAHPAL